jgi:branched-chain amino acid transport system substrate-binding protein
MIGRRQLLAGASAGLGTAIATRSRARAEQDAVTIGVISDMSGPYADLGGPGSVLAARMAVEDFGGSVLGQPIRILSADHGNKPDLARSLVGEWYAREAVTAVADGGASGAGLVIQELSRNAKRIFLAVGPATSDLTGPACSPYGFHWSYDTTSLGNCTAAALVGRGGTSWFFITADYAFGTAMQRDASAVVEAGGGKVLGALKVQIGTADFSSALLQAKSSGARVVALAVGGEDLINAVKQAVEFGLVQSGMMLAGLLTYNTDVKAIGLRTAQGLIVTSSYDWGINPAMKAFGERFVARGAVNPPSMVQAGTYSAVNHYLKAVKATGTTDGDRVAAQMRRTRLDDFMSEGAWIRDDGLVMRDMYVLAAKAPAQSKDPWDLFDVLATVPPEKAYRPENAGGCPLVKS